MYINRGTLLFVLLILPLWSVVAAASEHPAVQPAQDFSNSLFKMKSPDSAGWVGLSQNASRIAFVRSGASATDSDVAAVILFSVPVASVDEDFVALVRKGVEKDAPKPRFDVETSSLELSPDRPYTCAKYSATSIDHGETASLAPTKHLRLQLLSLYCKYPNKPGLGFAISFSHRGETAMPAFQQAAEAFIAGVQIAQADMAP